MSAAAEAKAVLRQHGRSFHLASLLLGARQGDRAAQLYALCRAIDDIADEAPDRSVADERLVRLSVCIASSDSDDPIAAQALWLKAQTDIDLTALQALIRGVRSDLGEVRIADEAALLEYAYAVAGTVGLMMCAVLDVGTERAYPFAIDLGIAMQLTNIARDVGEDARLGRRYLPAEWIGNIAPPAIEKPDDALAADLQKAVERLLRLADRYYESGEAGLGFLPSGARLAILVSSRLYRAIGERIEAAGYRTWQSRAYVSTPRKLAIVAKACFDYVKKHYLHRTDVIHDANLHILIRHLPATNGATAR